MKRRGSLVQPTAVGCLVRRFTLAWKKEASTNLVTNVQAFAQFAVDDCIASNLTERMTALVVSDASTVRIRTERIVQLHLGLWHLYTGRWGLAPLASSPGPFPG